MGRFFYETAALLTPAVCGVWIYAVVGSVAGAFEAIWWGGKGWFIPGYGTTALVLGAIPSYWIAQKVSLKMSGERPSLRRLAAIGLAQGLILFLVLEVFSLLINALISRMDLDLSGWVDLLFVIVKVTTSLVISVVLPTFIFAVVKRNSSRSG